ncbi:MAG: MBL fold metallo-hydrolase [Candidatus Brocadiia bacterium]
MPEDSIRFLGTAGARFVMARQLRSSAGTFVCLRGVRLVLDPGPGTLARCAAVEPPVVPTSLDAVLLTHSHIDHSGDINAVLDAMTLGGFRPRGRLYAPRECLEGEDPVVLRYVRKGLEEIVELEGGKTYAIPPAADRPGESLAFSTSAPHRHSTETYGLLLRPQDGPTVGFLADTEYWEGLAAAYADADVLVVNVVRHEPYREARILHLCLEEVRQVVEQVRPRMTVLTHFGVTMLEAGPEDVARDLGAELGLEVTAATDGMLLPLDELSA